MSLEIKPLKSIVLPVKLRSDTLTGTVSFDVEYRLSVFKRSKKPTPKNLKLKPRVGNVRFCQG